VTDPTSEPFKWWDCIRTWIPFGTSKKCRTSQRETSTTTNRTQWWRSASSKLHLNKEEMLSSRMCERVQCLHIYTLQHWMFTYLTFTWLTGHPFYFADMGYSVKLSSNLFSELSILYIKFTLQFSPLFCPWCSCHVTVSVFYSLRKWSISIAVPLLFNAQSDHCSAVISDNECAWCNISWHFSTFGGRGQQEYIVI
jgi:hypothetical protein